MEVLPPNSLVFKVRRNEPELVTPAKPTPREYKPLSDIDDREGHRFHFQAIEFHRCNQSMQGKDPAKVIRDALAKTLVFFYPFAGRLREGPNRKLIVDCTGEGVLFIEGDADITLEQFGELRPPFPGMEELLYDVPGYGEVLNSPLLLIQVTRLKCGGFILAIRNNHTMSDGVGLAQFILTLGEMARGAITPTILPVWERHLLNARNPPRITCTHNEFEEMNADGDKITHQLDNKVTCSLFFGPNEISVLRRRFVPPYHQCSKFDIVTAFLWRCHTIALQLDPEEVIRIICVVNMRSKFNPPLPAGYYGNVIAYPATLTTVGKLCRSPLWYAIELVKQTKAKATDEYMRSTADFLVTKGRAALAMARSFLVSDVRHPQFKDAGFGWGKAAYSGQANVMDGMHLSAFKNKKGEDGILCPAYLPVIVMERFIKELNSMKDEVVNGKGDFDFIKSKI